MELILLDAKHSSGKYFGKTFCNYNRTFPIKN